MKSSAQCCLLLAAVFLAGCVSEPQRPRTPGELPANWSLRLATTLTTAPLDQSWWAAFGDPVLQDLLARATADSPDLRIAADRVLAAGDSIRIAHSYEYPSLSLNIGPTDPAILRLANPDRSRSDVGEGQYELAFDASYEIDLWGRVRSVLSVARSDYEATLFDAGTTQIALRSAVARTYFQLRQIDEEESLQSRRAGFLQEQLRLTQLRVDAGRVALSEAIRIKLAQQDLDGRIAALRVQHALTLQALAVLIGETPESLQMPAANLRAVIAIPVPPQGLPSTLLERRPDIRSAEARLAEAEAQIGVARADRFPQLALTAEFGYLTASVNHLLHAGSALFGVGPAISFPIYDGGRRAAQEESRRHQYDAARAEYRKSILAGLSDVEKSLLEYQAATEAAARATEKAALLDSQQRAIEQRLSAGRASRLEILEIGTQALDAQILELQSYRDRLDALLALFQALGGGWDAAQLPQITSNP